MLNVFKNSNIPVLGIDPAAGPVKKALERGIPTLTTFFNKSLAKELCQEGKMADVFLGNNVLAHVSDLNGFVEGISTILKKNGVAVLECPYLIDLVDHYEFDTVYHQHLCYFSITALMPLFQRHNLKLNHIERTNIHGGSLRLFVSHEAGVSDELKNLLRDEEKRNIKSTYFFAHFIKSLAQLQKEIQSLLNQLKADNKKIIGYGAAAKATTLLHYFDIGCEVLDCIVDKNPHKCGWLMPGNHLSIIAPEKITEFSPDYIVILAWNFAKEIISQQSHLLDAGCKFIIPVPKLKIIGKEELGTENFELTL